MMKQLNAYTTEDLRRLSDYYKGEINKSEEYMRNSRTPRNQCQLWHSLDDEWFSLGLLDHALGRPSSEVLDAFRNSVNACKALFEIGAQPGHANPVNLAHAIHLALIVGQREMAVALARLREYRVAPYDERDFFAHVLVMADVVALMKYVLGFPLEAKEIALAQLSQPVPKGPTELPRFAAELKILVAIVMKDQDTFHSELASLLQFHERLARRGSLRESPEGLMSISGLALARLAMDAGMTVSLANPYLPLSLIQ